VINRYGFNSEGLDAVAERLAAFRRRAAVEPWRCPGLVAVNLGADALVSQATHASYDGGDRNTGKWVDPLKALRL
jgi:dihydroorotate dehydrogenase